jgi:flagellar biosynthetic protein FlhB
MSAGQKTEAPTPKRKKEGREKGQVARTPELTSWAGLLVATYMLKAAAASGMAATEWMTQRLTQLIEQPDINNGIAFLGEATWRFGLVIAPLCVSLMVVGVAGSFAQVGFVPSAKLLKPKWERINPAKGFKRIFGPMAAWEGGKSILKVSAIALAALPPLRNIATTLAGADRIPVESVAVIVGGGMMLILRNAALVGLLIAAADYAMQRRRNSKSLKMTKQEVRDEHKQNEGDPHMKGAIRERQMRMSRNRMMSDIASADAVLVNPTHVAVAIKYDPAQGAPKVVAKGAGIVAAKIRERAEEHGVPMVRDIPLARTLYRACEIGDEVPLDLYEAVARILAFVFALKARNLHSGVHELVA